MARILYFDIHVADYPRNSRIREHLVAAGHEVVVVERRDLEPYPLSALYAVLRGACRQGPFDWVVLSEMAVQYSLSAWLIAKRFRAGLIVDAFVGMYESNVEDWHRVSASSTKARIYACFDRVAAALAAITLVDTEPRALRGAAREARRPVVLPVGAPEWSRDTPRRDDISTLRVLYYGNYIPLHGLPYLLQAWSQVPATAGIELELLGDGEARPGVEQLAQDLSIHDRITWSGPVPAGDLALRITQADVVLGVFGTSGKAATVVANKTWQGLAMGRTVINRRTDALDPLRPLVGDLLIEVDPDRPDDLAEAIVALRTQQTDEGLPSRPGTDRVLEDYVQEQFAVLDAAMAR